MVIIKKYLTPLIDVNVILLATNPFNSLMPQEDIKKLISAKLPSFKGVLRGLIKGQNNIISSILVYLSLLLR